jgi:hypothetical protein
LQCIVADHHNTAFLCLLNDSNRTQLFDKPQNASLILVWTSCEENLMCLRAWLSSTPSFTTYTSLTGRKFPHKSMWFLQNSFIS